MADNPLQRLGELEDHLFNKFSAQIIAAENQLNTLSESLIRHIITISVAVMTFGISAASLFRTLRLPHLLASAWVSLLATAVLGFLLHRNLREIARLSGIKTATLEEQLWATIRRSDKQANELATKISDLAKAHDKSVERHRSYEAFLIGFFALGLIFMIIFGIANLYAGPDTDPLKFRLV